MVGYTDISHRPTAASYQRLVAAESADEHSQRGGQPYPFYLAHPLQAPTEQFDTLLGPPSAWQIEWKWDGIRARWSSARANCGSGRVAKSWLPNASPSCTAWRRRYPMAWCWTVKSWYGSQAIPPLNWRSSLLPCYSSASGARRWAKNC